MKFNETDRTYRQLNDFIRGELRRQRITQADLAYRMNMQPAGISRRLSGDIEWTAREVIDVFIILGVEHEWTR